MSEYRFAVYLNEKPDECIGVASTLTNLMELAIDLWHDDGFHPRDYFLEDES